MNGGQHFDDGETITFTINVGNLDSAYSYQLDGDFVNIKVIMMAIGLTVPVMS